MIGVAAFAAALLLARRRQLARPLHRLDGAAARAGGALGQARPFYRVTKPDGPGPFPTALLFSGCDGPKDNLERWAAMLKAEGWASIIVDSHGPRGFSDYEIWRLVCAGQLFMGSERAGDVLVAIDDARRMRFVDPDRIVLVGVVARRLGDHGPPGARPAAAAADQPRRAAAPARRADPLAGVAGVDPALPLLRPGQPRAAQRLDPADPDAVPAQRRRRDRPLGLLPRHRRAPAAPPACRCEVVLFDGVTHGFDQQDRSALSPLEFDPEATAEAMAIARAFLAEHRPLKRPGRAGCRARQRRPPSERGRSRRSEKDQSRFRSRPLGTSEALCYWDARLDPYQLVAALVVGR